MATKTLLELRTGARRRADMEEDDLFVTNTEATDYVNQSISALWDEMIDGDAENLFAIHAPVLTAAGDNSYLLPADFYRLVSIDFDKNGIYYPGTPGDPRHLALMAVEPPLEEHFRYYIRFNPDNAGRRLFTYPALDVSKLAVVYVPEAPALSADTDTFDAPNNWHEFVMIDAGIRMKIKEGDDPADLKGQRNEILSRIRDHIRNIDVGTPETIRDIADDVPRHRHLRYRYPRS